MIKYSIAKQFSRAPGPRYKSMGPFSGEAFRDEVLLPLVTEAQANNDSLLIDLDGGYGYGSSFLEESFGGLTRLIGGGPVKQVITFKSDEDAYLIADIMKVIDKEAGKK